MFRLAVASTPVTANIAANAKVIRDLIAEAAAAGARLACFGESALSGFVKTHVRRPDDWIFYNWDLHVRELRSIAATCAAHRIHAAVGSAHRLSESAPPHNCVYLIDDLGRLRTRHDKRFLSNSELQDWYTPGTEPVVFSIDGWRFGIAICIEIAFSEVFIAYGEMGVDGVVFATSGFPPAFQTATVAHAGLNHVWMAAATANAETAEAQCSVAGPDGRWMNVRRTESGLAFADLDRDDPRYDIALNRARPWRARARQGDIYRERRVDEPRSRKRDAY